MYTESILYKLYTKKKAVCIENRSLVMTRPLKIDLYYRLYAFKSKFTYYIKHLLMVDNCTV